MAKTAIYKVAYLDLTPHSENVRDPKTGRFQETLVGERWVSTIVEGQEALNHFIEMEKDLAIMDLSIKFAGLE